MVVAGLHALLNMHACLGELAPAPCSCDLLDTFRYADLCIRLDAKHISMTNFLLDMSLLAARVGNCRGTQYETNNLDILIVASTNMLAERAYHQPLVHVNPPMIQGRQPQCVSIRNDA